jgi:hypothetical protein
MKNIRKVMSNKAAIATWEDEGGALKPPFVPEVKTTSKQGLLICLGCLVVLPFFYWLMKR